MSDTLMSYLKNIDFFEHYGRRGMRWGVRRSDAELSKGDGKSDDASSKAPSSGKSSGSGVDGDSHVSVDAERFMKTLQKQGHEMSDREMREALNRADMARRYDAMFNAGENPNAALATKVETLSLQKKYNELDAELNPSAFSRIVKGAATGYSAYSKLNEASGGELNDLLGESLGLKGVGAPKHRGPGGFKLPKPRR